MPGKTQTQTASIVRDDNGVVHVVINEGVKVDYYDAVDQYLVIKTLANNEPVLKLIDCRARWSIQSKARRFLAGKDVKKKASAVAILQNSHLKKWLLNLIYSVRKPEVPRRVFTDYDDAYAWLMQVRKGSAVS